MAAAVPDPLSDVRTVLTVVEAEEEFLMKREKKEDFLESRKSMKGRWQQRRQRRTAEVKKNAMGE